MNSFAGSWFFENFQMARALLYGLIGLWIQEPLPERMKRLRFEEA